MRNELTTWRGSEVRYRPGKLFICLKRGVNKHIGLETIREFDRNIEVRGFFSPGIYEVNVSPQLTLKLASDMLASSKFRFVEIDRDHLPQ